MAVRCFILIVFLLSYFIRRNTLSTKSTFLVLNEMLLEENSFHRYICLWKFLFHFSYSVYYNQFSLRIINKLGLRITMMRGVILNYITVDSMRVNVLFQLNLLCNSRGSAFLVYVQQSCDYWFWTIVYRFLDYS